VRALAVYRAAREIKIIELGEPAIAAPRAVGLRILEVGVCGTDREIAAFEYGTPPAGSEYLVIGHERLAEVATVGAEVTHFKTGDLVVPIVRRPCAQAGCAPCRAGRQDFCTTGEYTERGIKGVHGFAAELVAEDPAFLVPVPPELREVAVLTEPLTIAEKALSQVWQVQQRLPWGAGGSAPGAGLNAVVLGAGPVGFLGALVLASAGFTTFIYSRDPQPQVKADLAASFGATYVSSTTHTVEALAKTVGRIDLVYEAVGASRLAFEVLELLGRNAVFVFTGVPGRKAPIEVDTDRLMRSLVLDNQLVLGTVNAPRAAYEAAVRDLGVFAKRWPAAVRALITGRFPLEAHRDLLLGSPGGIKNVFAIGAAAERAA
jgi:threonine dehydrogenase-like Zn-dependent dehydrogenase